MSETDIQLSSWAANISPSPTLAVDSKAKAMKAAGEDVCGFGAGEPDFDTPERIKQAGIRAIEANDTHYTPVGGSNELKDAIITKMKRDSSLDYERNQILVSCGAKHSFYNLAQTLWEEGDEVIIPAPYWVSFPEMVGLAGAKAVIIDTDATNNFKITVDQIKEVLTAKTRAILINTPSNPTGFAYEKSELEAIAEFALENNLLMISDEIYEWIIFDDFKHTSIASLSSEAQKNCVVINGVSKCYAMTGWRIGYIAAPQWIAAACTKLQGQFTSGASGISQKATERAMQGGGSLSEDMKAAFLERRDMVVAGLKAIDGFEVNVPQGAFYIFPDVSALFGKSHPNGTIQSGQDLSMYLLEAADVATVGGDAFGSPNCIRISYAASEVQLQEAIRRIGKAIAELSE